MVNIPFLGALAGCSARRSSLVWRATQARSNAAMRPQGLPKMGYWLFLPPLSTSAAFDMPGTGDRRDRRALRPRLRRAQLAAEGCTHRPGCRFAAGRHCRARPFARASRQARRRLLVQGLRLLPRLSTSQPRTAETATFATGFSTPWPATLPKQQPESTGSLQRQCDIQEPFRAQSSRLMNCAELRHCIAASGEPMPTFGRTAFSRM